MTNASTELAKVQKTCDELNDKAAQKEVDAKNNELETITPEKWQEYRGIQDSGMFNMFDPRAREMTDLSRPEWITIMKYYSELRQIHEG